jgi:cytochrome c biogenesis protein CcmG, thiol:disulfide interchange protein DsbE
MGRRVSPVALFVTVAVVLCIGAVVWVVAADDEVGDPGAADPKSAATDYDDALAAAPPPLAELYDEGNVILDGGPQAFEAQVAELEGYPVVVNKWASWCGPCRYEFPFFQRLAAERGDEIAFIGVQSDDSTDAGLTFLEEFPLPYPSFSDPEQEIAESFEGFSFPSTALYDETGKLVHTRQGPYESRRDLADEIDRYLG